MTSWKVSNTNNTIARHIYWIIMFKIIYRSIFLMTNWNLLKNLWIFSSFLPRVDCFAQNRCAKNRYTFTYRCRKTFLNIPVDNHAGRMRVRMCRYFDMDSICNLHLWGKKVLMDYIMNKLVVRWQKQWIVNDANVH